MRFAKTAIATATLLMLGGASYAQDQGSRAGVPSNTPGTTMENGTPATGYSTGRSAMSPSDNSPAATERHVSSGQGSGPRAGSPNGN